MLLHAILERGAAFLRLVAALRPDVRPASFSDRRGGERGMAHHESRAERSDAGQGPHFGCPPVAMRARLKSGAPWGRAFLEHGADGVNDFLVQAGAAVDDRLTPRD